MGSKTEVDNEYINKRHDDYLGERNALNQGEFECSRSYDKYLVVLSSGALGLSLTFVENIAPNPVSSKTMLWAWGALVVCLCSTVLSLLMGQFAYRLQRHQLDTRHKEFLATRAKEEPVVAKDNNVYSRIINVLSVVSAVTFIAGLCLLTLFGMVNLDKRSKDVEKRPTVTTPASGVEERPAQPPPPAVTRPEPPKTPPKPKSK